MSAIERTQVEIITLQGDGLGFALHGGLGVSVGIGRGGGAEEAYIGPIVGLAKDKFRLTLNPLFFKERDELA